MQFFIFGSSCWMNLEWMNLFFDMMWLEMMTWSSSCLFVTPCATQYHRFMFYLSHTIIGRIVELCCDHKDLTQMGKIGGEGRSAFVGLTHSGICLLLYIVYLFRWKRKDEIVETSCYTSAGIQDFQLLSKDRNIFL